MKPIETTVQRDCDYDGHAYQRGDRLDLPLVDALRLAHSGVVRLGYRPPPVVPRRRRKKAAEAQA